LNRFLSRFWPGSSSEPADRISDSVPFSQSMVAGLDVEEALQAHLRLKERLLACTRGTCDDSLNAELLCFDNRCALGRWLYGPAHTRMGHHRGFTDLLEQHRMFHIAASNVVALARAGRLDQSRDMADVQLQAFSNGVLRRLHAMKSWVDRRQRRRLQRPGTRLQRPKDGR
jgi:hypothetical protein